MKSKHLSLILFLALCALQTHAGTPNWYVKKGSWQETMTASLQAIQAQDAAWQKALDGVELGTWHTTRPAGADSDGKMKLPQDGKVNFTTGKKDKDRKDKKKKPTWSRIRYADGDLTDLSLRAGYGVFLAREIESTKTRWLTAYLTLDADHTVYLNQQPVRLEKAKRPRDPARVRLALKAGRNVLLVGIFNRDGASPFLFSLLPREGVTGPEERFAALSGFVASDFTDPRSRDEIRWELEDRIWSWNRDPSPATLASQIAKRIPGDRRKEANELAKKADPGDLATLRTWYYGTKRAAKVAAEVKELNLDALQRAVTHLTDTFGARYPKGRDYLARIASFKREQERLMKEMAEGKPEAITKVDAIIQLRREALLANPLLDFDKLLVVARRKTTKCLPNNYHGNCQLPRGGFDDSIDALDIRTGAIKTIFKPDTDVFVGDVDLDFDAKTMLFSSLDERRKWQIYEVAVNGSGFRQVTPGTEPDVDNYDACYLPDGRIIFGSTRCFAGVPCVGGNAQVANFYMMNRDGSGIRQLCFDQEHDMYPVVTPAGKILYTRWEYTDTPHYFTRILMTMNPDGTQQMGYYGSNSYWPTSILYARPVPGHATKFMAIVSGHHGTARSGELHVFDTSRGRHEADGVVQQIPGYGKTVEPVIKDRLVDGVSPHFLHPYPLSEEFCLAAVKMSRGRWAIYLVDTFDNMLKLYDRADADLYEPVPLRPTPRPPIMPDKVDLKRKDAVVYMVDIYRGPGLTDIPRGEVKELRVFQWHYAYNRMGGHNAISIEGGWEPKRILGTVPVEDDGSALFRVPANTPLAVQPLDEKGRALQLMRSWFTAQPGEVLSCIGCHETANEAPQPTATEASRRAPSELTPFQGPARGVSFIRDVQPILERHCVSCHNGSKTEIPDFKDTSKVKGFTKSYQALHPFVRRPGPESDYHIFPPLEYHSSTSELIQMLAKGHKGVKLSQDEVERLYLWIDLNVPDYGTWTEQRGESPFMARRAEMAKLYADVNDDPETLPKVVQPVKPLPARPAPRPPAAMKLSGWPLSAEQAGKAQAALGNSTRKITLGEGVDLQLVRIPAGKFAMGDVTGFADEWPQSVVTIKKPFWMGKFEISNRQYHLFDPKHDSRYIDQQWKDHTTPGYPANEPDQPVIRITWNEAMAFCEWLSKKTGRKVSLPTEAQWEYACRAGTATPLWYGTVNADFHKLENLGDASLIRMAVKGVNPKAVENPDPLTAFLPRETRFNDGQMITTKVGAYQANPWGLHDMHGNVAEWTRSDYVPYPYRDQGGKKSESLKVMRGGSWRDRPKWSRSSLRRGYEAWQPVYNGGFRVIMED